MGQDLYALFGVERLENRAVTRDHPVEALHAPSGVAVRRALRERTKTSRWSLRFTSAEIRDFALAFSATFIGAMVFLL